MRRSFDSGAWGRLARIGALSVGVLALAGCATGYSFVQPDAGSTGGYYTSAEAYPAPNYVDDGDFGAYDAYAGFDDYSLYGPSFTFGPGFGSPCGWSCGSYYGGWPWYYGEVGYYGWRRHHGHHHHDDPVATTSSPRPWLKPDPVRIAPSRGARGSALAVAVPERPRENLASRRPLESASFAPRHDIGAIPQPVGTPEQPVYMDRQLPAAVSRPMTIRSAPSYDFARPAGPAAAPMHAAPPPAPSSHGGADKIH